MSSQFNSSFPAPAVTLTALAFCGYFLSAIVGPSVVFTLSFILGLSGLTVLALVPFKGEPDLNTPAWLQRGERFLLATTVFYFVAKRCSLLLHEWPTPCGPTVSEYGQAAYSTYITDTVGS